MIIIWSNIAIKRRKNIINIIILKWFLSYGWRSNEQMKTFSSSTWQPTLQKLEKLLSILPRFLNIAQGEGSKFCVMIFFMSTLLFSSFTNSSCHPHFCVSFLDSFYGGCEKYQGLKSKCQICFCFRKNKMKILKSF